MIASGIRKAAIGGFCLLVGLLAFAQMRPSEGVLNSSYRVGKPSFPAAAYRNISVAEFRSMVRKAFQASGFSLVSIDEQKNKSTIVKFNFNSDLKMAPKPEILVSTDELLDDKRRCNPCFLRFAEIKNAAEIAALPWMTQYDQNALLVPAIDKAYSTLESSGREHLDPAFKFNYKPQWAGEKNLFGNSFVGISLPSLKERVVRAYRDAGFIPVESDASPKSPELALAFNFPLDPPKDGGAIYKVLIRSQYDADGNCYPCELTEQYDPYQQLPPPGLSGLLSRATLDSRFTAARNAAYESVRIDLERNLRPRSGFSMPAKPEAALGTPRPPPRPVVVT
ncbi:hypothetical protein [Variovorax sp. KBW07]|uniref:hypothetical protein n=1 Tax=Variovorax sp. KBW07 TaxID=2153358 RepID=UPI0021A9BDFB|nr:hypothetical protein [Variovorax sp. KBW07]